MKLTRPVWCIAGAAAAVVLGAASYAYACSASHTLAPLSPDAGPRSSEVTVSSRNWSASSGSLVAVGPVEIRWGGESGPLLATAAPESDTFSVKVTIPDAGGGYYLITAVSRTASSQVVGSQSKTFRVTAPASTGTTTGGSTGQTGAGITAPAGPAGQTAEPIAEPTAPQASEGDASTPAPAATTSPELGRGTAAPAASVVASSGSATASSQPTDSSLASGPVKAPMPVRPAGVPGPSLAVAAPPVVATLEGVAPPKPAEAPATPATPLPDPSTFWAGADTSSSGARPSLVSEPPTGGSGAPGAMAAALLAIGTVSLFGTALVVAVGRRRASAHASQR